MQKNLLGFALPKQIMHYQNTQNRLMIFAKIIIPGRKD